MPIEALELFTSRLMEFLQLRNRIARGYARKISMGFIALSFIGWIILTAGVSKYAEYRSRYYDDDGFNGLWTLSVIGPLLHILALAHVMLWGRPSSILGSITAFLSVVYMTGVGFIMVYGGILTTLYNRHRYYREYYGRLYIEGVTLSFAGGLITSFFWAGYLTLWPWLRIEVEREDSNNQTANSIGHDSQEMREDICIEQNAAYSATTKQSEANDEKKKPSPSVAQHGLYEEVR